MEARKRLLKYAYPPSTTASNAMYIIACDFHLTAFISADDVKVIVSELQFFDVWTTKILG